MKDNDRTWLTLWAWGVVIFGLALATFALPATDAPGRLMFDILGNSVPADPDAHLRFAVGLMGCVTMGWGVTFLAAFRAAWALPAGQARPIWRLIVTGALVWFIPDSLLSVVTGFALNAVSNTVLLVLLLVPLLRSGVLKAA
ncbi:hypothetical protein D5I55_17285 [Chakrabartia godavariana]|nr:hypothetical protein D5I55_17285 [Chakrabartia godavariana]